MTPHEASGGVSQLPALLVLVPLCAAPLCVLLRSRRVALALAAGASWAAFGIALALLFQVDAHGTIRYPMGGWAAPYGIEFRIDLLSAFVATFVAMIGGLTATFAPASVRAEIPRDRHALFAGAFLLALTGLLGIVVTGDLFNLFVFLEISSLPSYALISLGRSRRALTAAFQYLVLGTLGATFYLIAVGLIYMMTGSLNMLDVAARLPDVESTRTIWVAFAFLTAGLALKSAVFPLHLWLPAAYTHAPSVVSAFLAATATKVSLYVLLRTTAETFGLGFSFGVMPLELILAAAGLLAMFVGSTVAIFQTDFKLLLAYSSIAQVGYIVLGFSFGSVDGLTAGIVHLFNHGVTKGAMFLALGCIAYRIGSSQRVDLRGLGRRMPLTCLLWLLGGFSLIGVPGTAGFVSKLYLVRAAIGAHDWLVAGLILLSSLLAVVYVWRFVETVWFQEPAGGEATRAEAPLALLLPTAALIGLTLWFGFHAESTAGLAARAAEALLAAAPGVAP